MSYADTTTGYPLTPGSKELGGPSEAAAVAIAGTARELSDQVYAVLVKYGPHTADEVAELLHRDRLSIRPRLSELFKQGFVRKTGQRRRNASGQSANVWEAIRVQQRLF